MSNLNKRLSYVGKCSEKEYLSFQIETILVAENTEIVSSISFSEMWKIYDCVNLSEKQIEQKMLLDINNLKLIEEVTDGKFSHSGLIDTIKSKTSGKDGAFEKYQDYYNGFVDSLLDKNLKSGISSFPFIQGKQYFNLQEQIVNWISTLEYNYSLNDEVVEKIVSEDKEKVAPVEAAKR